MLEQFLIFFYMNKKALLMMPILLLFSEMSYGLTHFSGNWDDIVLNKRNKNFTYYFRLQSRFNFDDPQNNELVVTPAIAYSIIPKLNLGVGYDHFQPYEIPDNRRYVIWQQAQYTLEDSNSMNIWFRTRPEQLISHKSEQVYLRVREMFFIKFRDVILGKFSPVITEEIFINLNRPDWISSETFSQNRFFIGMEFPCNKETSVLSGYMNNVNFNTNSTIMRHILYASLILSF